jgi:hypothetical protein
VGHSSDGVGLNGFEDGLANGIAMGVIVAVMNFFAFGIFDEKRQAVCLISGLCYADAGFCRPFGGRFVAVLIVSIRDFLENVFSGIF